MAKTFENRHEALSWQFYQDQFAPKPGDVAPDFELGDVEGKSYVCLSDFKGKKPIALIFGSFT